MVRATQRIVVISKDAEDTKLFEKYIDRSDLKVIFSSSGEEGIKSCVFQSADLAIINAHIEDMALADLTEALLKKLKKIKIMFLAPPKNLEIIHECFLARADDVYVRPVQKKDILTRILRLIDGKFTKAERIDFEMDLSILSQNNEIVGLSKTLSPVSLTAELEKNLKAGKNYRVTIRNPNQGAPVKTWTRLEHISCTQSNPPKKYSGTFRFLNLDLNEWKNITKGYKGKLPDEGVFKVQDSVEIPTDKPMLFPMALGAFLLIAAIAFAVKSLYFRGPSPVEIPDVTISLKTPIPYDRVKISGDMMIIFVSHHWNEFSEEKKVELTEKLLSEKLEYDRFTYMDAKGTIKGRAVRGQEIKMSKL